MMLNRLHIHRLVHIVTSVNELICFSWTDQQTLISAVALLVVTAWSEDSDASHADWRECFCE